MKTLDLTLRQRKLLHVIQNLNTIITGPDLAKQLKVSPRTIRSDVIAINQALAPYHAQIVSKRSAGYLFKAENPEEIQKMNQIETAFFTSEDRVRYLAFTLCLSDTCINLYDLEDEIFVSRTTLDHDIHSLKAQFTLNEPYIQMIRNGDNVEYEKDEKKRRSVLKQLFYQDWNYNTKGNAYYNYDFIDVETMDWIMNEVPRHLNRYNIQMEDPSLVSLDLALAIMYYRTISGHPLPPAESITKTDHNALSACNDLFVAVENHLHTSFSDTEKDEIYLIIAAGHLLDATKLNVNTVTEYFSRLTIDITDQYLHKIIEVFGLDFTNDEDFYITLLQFIRYLQNPLRLFNSQGNVDITKEYLLVEFEIANLIQSIAKEHLGFHLNQIELIYLSHCISGAMEYLYRNHPETKLKTVVACHMNLASMWGLKRKLLGAFDNYINIEALLPVNAKSIYDFSDTDLVLTTVKKQITDNKTTDVLQISSNLAPNDYRSIEDYIRKKRYQKLFSNPNHTISELLENAFYHETIHKENPTEIINNMAEDFIRSEIADESYHEDILQREANSSFAYKPGILLIHSLQPASQTKLSVSTLDHRIYWNNHKIRLIIMACFKAEDDKLLFYLQYHFCIKNYTREDLKKLKTRNDVITFFANTI